MKNYKQINENWQEFLTEARYDFKPGSPTNNVSREVNQVLKQRVMGWATEAAGEKRDPEDLIFYKRLSLAPADMKPQWLYFFKAGDSQMVPVPVPSLALPLSPAEIVDACPGFQAAACDIGHPHPASALSVSLSE